MRLLRHVLCVFLTFCLFLPAALCENVGDAFVLGVLSTRTTELRPLRPQERDLVSLYAVIYESLVVVDDNGIPQPHLAESWAETGNGKTWTFKLRENIVFSDGTPLTAYDVVASCEYLLALAKSDNAAERGFYQNIRYMVKSISAPDEKTVIVKAERSYYGLLYAMTFPVVPASQVDMPSPVGTGPYRVQSFEAGNYLFLTANENWWQSAPNVKTITATFYKNNNDLITAYEYGRVDAVFTRSVAAAQYKSGINALSITYSTRQLETLMLNHRAFPLDSLKVRQAIRYALNIPQISYNVFMGMTIDANTPVSSGSWLYYDQEDVYTFNLEKARALLEEDGWGDSDQNNELDKLVDGNKKNLVLRLYVYEDPENNIRYETANMIADMLDKIDITVNVKEMTYEDELALLESGSFDMALAAFHTDVVPDYGFFLMRGNTQNYCRYNSSEMTTLFSTLRSNQSQTDFFFTSQAIQKQFTNDVPFICLFYRAGAILTRKMFTSVRDIREYELLRGIEAFGR